jgi:hypothetical protein
VAAAPAIGLADLPVEFRRTDLKHSHIPCLPTERAKDTIDDPKAPTYSGHYRVARIVHLRCYRLPASKSAITRYFRSRSICPLRGSWGRFFRQRTKIDFPSSGPLATSSFADNSSRAMASANKFTELGRLASGKLGLVPCLRRSQALPIQAANRRRANSFDFDAAIPE